MSELRALTGAMRDHAAASGLFARVNGHEPKHNPGKGLTCTVWFERLITSVSGMNATSVCVVMNVRLYAPLTSAAPEVQDAVDPDLMAATDKLLRAYCGDFTLGGRLRAVDIRGGESGVSLEAVAGYVTIESLHRVVTITVPLVVNDLWPEAP